MHVQQAQRFDVSCNRGEQQQLLLGIELAKLFNMINSWIIYLRLSLCHYVNKMIIGSSYGFVHGFASLYAVDVIFFLFL